MAINLWAKTFGASEMPKVTLTVNSKVRVFGAQTSNFDKGGLSNTSA